MRHRPCKNGWTDHAVCDGWRDGPEELYTLAPPGKYAWTIVRGGYEFESWRRGLFPNYLGQPCCKLAQHSYMQNAVYIVISATSSQECNKKCIVPQTGGKKRTLAVLGTATEGAKINRNRVNDRKKHWTDRQTDRHTHRQIDRHQAVSLRLLLWKWAQRIINREAATTDHEW